MTSVMCECPSCGHGLVVTVTHQLQKWMLAKCDECRAEFAYAVKLNPEVTTKLIEQGVFCGKSRN